MFLTNYDHFLCLLLNYDHFLFGVKLSGSYKALQGDQLRYYSEGNEQSHGDVVVCN